MPLLPPGRLVCAPRDGDERWPRWISADELAEMCLEARLFVDPRAPIGRELARQAARSASATCPDSLPEDVSGPSPVLDGVTRAVLVTVAAPDRVLLLVRETGGVTRGSMFLQRGELLVRVAPAEGRWLLSAPSSRARFADGVCRALEIADAQPRQPTAMAWLPIGAATALQRAASPPGGQLADADRAAGGLGPLGARAPNSAPMSDLIAALAAGDPTAAGGEALELMETWLDELAVSLEPERARLYAIEVADLDRPIVPRRMVLTGRGSSRQVALCPAESGPGRNRVPRLKPAVRQTVRAAVVALTDGPPGPATRPVAVAERIDSRLLSPRAEGAKHGRWHVGDPIDIGANYNSRPDALSRPIATIQCVAEASGVTSRRVFAIGGRDAAEWEMHGTRVRWRHLPDSEVLSAVIGLIPGWGATVEGGPIPLSEHVIDWVVNGRPIATEPLSMPAELRGLLSAPDLTWINLVVECGTQTGIRCSSVRLCASAREGVWRFSGAAVGEAERISQDQLRAELLGLLRASDSADSVQP